MSDNIVEIIIKAIDQASGTLDKIGKSGGNLEKSLVANWKAIGLAAAAAGGAIEVMARQQGQLSTATDKLSVTTKLQASEINEVARQVAGAGDSIKETLEVMNLGGEQGLKSKDALKEYASFWDTVGDASGEASADLADAAVSLEQFGISAENVTDAGDAFAFMLTETTYSIGEFLDMCKKTGPSVEKFDLDINDMAILLDSLEEKGLTGKQAISAINDAAANSTNLQQFIANIERATGAEVNFSRSTDGGTESLNAQAEAVDKNLTPIQKLTSSVQELQYQYGETIQTAAALVPALVAIGPAIKTFSELKTIIADIGIASKLSAASVSSLTASLEGASLAAGAGGLAGAAILLGASLAIIIGIIAAANYEAEKSGEVWKTYTAEQAEAEKNTLQMTGTMGDLGGTVQDTNADLGQGVEAINDLGGAYDENGNIIVGANQRIAASAVEMVNTTIAAINMLTPAAQSAASSIDFLTQSGVNLYPVNGENNNPGDFSTWKTNVGSGKNLYDDQGYNPDYSGIDVTKGYGGLSQLDTNTYAYYWIDGTGQRHDATFDYMNESQTRGMDIGKTGWSSYYYDEDTSAWKPESGVGGGDNPFLTKYFMEMLKTFTGGVEIGGTANENAKAVEQQVSIQADATNEIVQSTKVTDQNTQATIASNQSIIAQNNSIFEMIKKFGDSNSAMGKSSGSLADWNTDIVGQTDDMATNSIGSVEGMKTGVASRTMDTTRNISGAWGQIGADSQAGTQGLGQDWSSFLDSARRSLQSEISSCGPGGCGVSGTGSDDTGTGTKPPYDWDWFNRTRIPRAARGGNINRSGYAVVGEAGEELVHLGSGASVTPLSSGSEGLAKEIAREIGKGGGNTVNVTINAQAFVGDKGTARKFARWIADNIDFEKKIRRGVTA